MHSEQLLALGYMRQSATFRPAEGATLAGAAFFAGIRDVFLGGPFEEPFAAELFFFTFFFAMGDTRAAASSRASRVSGRGRRPGLLMLLCGPTRARRARGLPFFRPRVLRDRFFQERL